MNWIYDSPLWLRSGHSQTIYPALVAKHLYPDPINWERKRIFTKDNDFIDLEWSEHAKDKSELCILFHGLEGNSKSHYAIAFANHLKEKNIALCVPHFRGCSGEINSAPRAYHSGDYEEVAWIIERIKESFDGTIWAVGVSLGGNALLRWAQEAGAQASKYVTGVGSICAPLDLMQSGLQIGKGINHWFYEKRFLKTMKKKAAEKIKQFPGLFDYEMVRKAKSLYEFDNYFTAPLHGFKSTVDYWENCSSNLRMGDIKVNHFVLNSLNDPFIPAASLPLKTQFNSYGRPIYTSGGGHVGYTHSEFPGKLNALPDLVQVWMKS